MKGSRSDSAYSLGTPTFSAETNNCCDATLWKHDQETSGMQTQGTSGLPGHHGQPHVRSNKEANIQMSMAGKSCEILNRGCRAHVGEISPMIIIVWMCTLASSGNHLCVRPHMYLSMSRALDNLIQDLQGWQLPTRIVGDMWGSPLGDLGLQLSGICGVARWETWVSSCRGYVGCVSVVCICCLFRGPLGDLGLQLSGICGVCICCLYLLGWGEEEKEKKWILG